MNQTANPTQTAAGTPDADVLAPIRGMVNACMQCGTCSASCPNAFAMDHTPRQLWRLVMLGQKEAIFSSKTFALCSACYYCTLRCPRGLPLTDAMAALKQVAAREHLALYRQSDKFYGSFMESVRRHGRVREMEFMTLFFWHMKSPFIPLKFASLGLKLMGKGKVSLQIPNKGKGALDAIFRKVAELEAR